MWGWIVSNAGGAIFKIFGDSILSPILNAWAKGKDVDLQKLQSELGSSGALAAAVVKANVEASAQQIAYASSILSWWPFRVLLFALMFFPTLHFAAIMLDSSCPQSWGWHIVDGKVFGGCGWGVPKVPSPYDGYEREFILFFIIAKPVDSLVSSVGAGMANLLRKSKA